MIIKSQNTFEAERGEEREQEGLKKTVKVSPDFPKRTVHCLSLRNACTDSA